MKKRNWYYAFGGIGAVLLDLFAACGVMLLYVIVARCRQVGASISGTQIDNTLIEILATAIVFGLLVSAVFAVMTAIRGFAKKKVPLGFIVVQLIVHVLICVFLCFNLFTSDSVVGGVIIVVLYVALIAVYVLGIIHEVKYRN